MHTCLMVVIILHSEKIPKCIKYNNGFRLVHISIIKVIQQTYQSSSVLLVLNLSSLSSPEEIQLSLICMFFF